jgi:predicted amidohydrolase YtcJ
MLLPGFQDAHVHPIEAGMAYLGCSLHGATSIAEYLKVLEACDRSFPESTFVDGGGWTMDLFPNGLPDKKLIDSVIPSRPVILKSATGHQLWVNSAALEMAGIDSESVDPPRGRIDRYPGSNVPSGSLQENSAMNLVLDARPPYSEQQMMAALQFGQFYLNQYGVTSVQDALLKLDGNEAYVGGPTYMALEEAGNLTLKVSGAIVWNTDLGVEQISRILVARERFNTRRLKARSVKIWLDGVLEVHTAALLAPYSDKEDGTAGELLIPPKMLREVITKLDALDFQIHFHAIGDAAIRASLDAIEIARSINGKKDNRHHISHIQLFNPADIPRFAELGVAANFQPYWAWADKFITELTIPKLGEERSQWLYPIKSLLDSGALVVFGSDWFVSSGNPLLGIETAITRRDPLTNESEPFLDHQRIGLGAALRAYTLNSAYINFIEHETGSIEVGKQADLTVLDKNLFDLKSSEISEASVLLTLIDGERVYGEWSLAPLGKTAL